MAKAERGVELSKASDEELKAEVRRRRKAIASREELLGPYMAEPGPGPAGGLGRFSGMPAEVLRALTDAGLSDEGPWNDCPGNNAFLAFMEGHPGWLAHGYAINPPRSDARVTVEGLEKFSKDGEPLTAQDRLDFALAFRGADELEVTPGYARCWYD